MMKNTMQEGLSEDDVFFYCDPQRMLSLLAVSALGKLGRNIELQNLSQLLDQNLNFNKLAEY